MATAKKQKKSVKKFSPLVSVKKFSNKQLGLLVAAVAVVGVGVYFYTHAATNAPIAFTTLSYNQTDGTTSSISTINSDGTNSKTIFPKSAHTSIDSIQYSPDRTKIAWLRRLEATGGCNGYGGALMIYDTLTGKTANPPTYETIQKFSWYPDSKKIAYSTINTCTSTTYIYRLDTTTLQTTSNNRLQQLGNVFVSSIAVTDTNYVVFSYLGTVYSHVPGSSTPLTLNSANCGNVQARHGGTNAVSYVCSSSSNDTVYRQRADGTNRAKIYSLAKASGTATKIWNYLWSPSGQTVAYEILDNNASPSWHQTLVTTAADGTNAKTLYTSVSKTGGLCDCEVLQHLAWSAGSDSLALTTTSAANAPFIERVSADGKTSNKISITNLAHVAW